jgi:hypothetical protein
MALCSNLFAQKNSAEQMTVENLKKQPLNGFFGLTFTNAVPQGDFQTNLNKTGLGLSIFGGYNADPIPLSVGMNADVLFFGGDTKYFTYQRPGGWKGGTDTVETQSMVIPVTVFARLQPKAGIFSPYLEAFAGVNFLSTSADFTPYIGEKDSKSKFNASWTYGLGAGLSVKLVEFINLPSSHSTLNADFRMKYAWGSEADYYKVKIGANSEPIFTSFRSKTDMIITSVGISFSF